jgi:tRNA A58 N-methylase Trm61
LNIAIEAFENEVDEFEEAVEDVDEIFFDVPNDLEFIALAKKI